MDVILKADVKGLGKKGEKVKASDGYARNFLFPKGLAVEANAQSLTELRNREQSNQHKIDVEVAAANESKAKLQGKIVKITAKAGNNGKLFGSVTSKEVAAESSANNAGAQQTEDSAIKKAVEEINKKAKNSEAKFGIHDDTNRVTIKIVDKETQKVLKEFPPEKTLDMIARVWEMAGLMVDEKR